MNQLVPVIDHVLELLDQEQIRVSDREEMRATLILLRSLALEKEVWKEQRDTLIE